MGQNEIDETQESIAENLSARVDRVLRNVILDDHEDFLDVDQLNEKIYDKFKDIHS